MLKSFFQNSGESARGARSEWGATLLWHPPPWRARRARATTPGEEERGPLKLKKQAAANRRDDE